MKERWVKVEHRLPTEAYWISLEMYPPSGVGKKDVCSLGELCTSSLSPCSKQTTYAVFAGARIVYAR